MTSNSNTGSRNVVAATALMLGMLTTSAYAYSPEQEQLCTPDAMRLCSSEIPDVERVTACMIRNKSQLSAGCKSVFQAPAPTQQATPVSYRPSNGSNAKPSKPLSLTPKIR